MNIFERIASAPPADKVRRIYLDNNATMPVRPEVAERLHGLGPLGNPSSIHAEGRKARALLEEARQSVADWAGVSPNRVIFTSGGTEANALAIHGLLRIKPGARMHPGSHPSIRENLRGVEESDEIRFEMAAHNETGEIFDIATIIATAKAARALVHVDAVQMPGKLPFDPILRGADSFSISGHKIGGPMGAGALVCPTGLEFEPILRGGGQEFGRRSGTPPLQAIIGLGIALKLPYDTGQCRKLARRLLDRLRGRAEFTEVSKCSVGLPGTLLLAFEKIPGDVLVPALDVHGIAASYGSACSSGEQAPSEALIGMGLDDDTAKRCVRFSIGPQNTAEEIDGAADKIIEAIEHVKKTMT